MDMVWGVASRKSIEAYRREHTMSSANSKASPESTRANSESTAFSARKARLCTSRVAVPSAARERSARPSSLPALAMRDDSMISQS